MTRSGIPRVFSAELDDAASTAASTVPRRVGPAGRLDDPAQHQFAKHVVALSYRLKNQHPVGNTQSVPEMTHSRGGDRQRAGTEPLGQPEVQRSSTPPTRPRHEPNRCVRSNATHAAGPHDLPSLRGVTVRTKATSAAYGPALVLPASSSRCSSLSSKDRTSGRGPNG